ncbi:hypothetical protein NMY22_g17143 [Coprinellus aureogranulatus]|nr:hypothetical protein NMY22_g17143 [Coprinellus aureogranulatus]
MFPLAPQTRRLVVPRQSTTMPGTFSVSVVPLELWMRIYPYCDLQTRRAFRELSQYFRYMIPSFTLAIIPFSGFAGPVCPGDYVCTFLRLSAFCKFVKRMGSVQASMEHFLMKVQTVEIFALEAQLHQKSICKILRVLKATTTVIMHTQSSPTPSFHPFLERALHSVAKLKSLSLLLGSFEDNIKTLYRVHGEANDRDKDEWVEEYRRIEGRPLVMGQCTTPFCESECIYCINPEMAGMVNTNRPWSSAAPLVVAIQDLGMLKPLKDLHIFVSKKDYVAGEEQEDLFANLNLGSFRSLNIYVYERLERGVLQPGASHLIRKTGKWELDSEGEWKYEESELAEVIKLGMEGEESDEEESAVWSSDEDYSYL